MAERKAIHAPYDKFKGFLREKRLTYCDIANLLGLSVGTVSQKVNGNSDFYLNEMKIIKEAYNPEDDIFC